MNDDTPSNLITVSSMAESTATPPPSLPLNVVELILAVTAQQAQVPLVSLLNVLAPAIIPAAFCSAICAMTNADYDRARDIFVCLFSKSTQAQQDAVLSILRPICARYDCEVMIFDAACRSDNLHVLEWWKVKNGSPSESPLPTLDGLYAINGAIAFGHRRVLDWWRSMDFSIAAIESNALEQAAGNGYLDTLKWVQAHPDGLPYLQQAKLKHQAAKAGRVNILDWCLQLDGNMDFDYSMWKQASAAGHVSILQWALDQGHDMVGHVQYCVDVAAGAGHIGVLDWFFEHVPAGQFAYSVWAMDMASLNGHLAVLNWFATTGLELKFTPAAVSNAYKEARKDIVQWWAKCKLYKQLMSGNLGHLRALNRVPTDVVTLASFGYDELIDKKILDKLSHAVLVEVFFHAGRHGHVQLFARWQRPYLDRVAQVELCRVVEQAIHENQVAVVRWIHHKYGPTVLNSPDLDNKIIGAAEYGHCGIMQFLLSIDRVNVSLLGRCIEAAAKWGRLDLLDLFDGFDAFAKVESSTLETAFVVAAAENGQYVVLDWWLESNLPFPSSKQAISGLIDKASANGYSLVLQWWKESGMEFQFTELALWDAIKKRQKCVIRWWIDSGLVFGPFMIEALKDAARQLAT
ncbi:hypothetical protein BCR44DRAFT_44350 [Catenaria anguillulae PL171]|uniref:Ankyrin repeat-containing domain protein n=1 Tax=Catenaria anguillulae PL171 TaxID=765915 RepID=A0A1Y2H8H0_9FUNG|nr:hypothetical protein BCR44DRAFT_44350 [Catenaria anguillulae PL171]